MSKIVPLKFTGNDNNTTPTILETSSPPPSSSNIVITESKNYFQLDAPNDFQNVLSLLKQNKVNSAAQLINDRYSYLSASELKQIKQQFIALASNQQERIKKQKNTLIAASQVFDDLDISILLANSAIKNQDWELAHSANLKASMLENSPEDLSNHLNRLVFSARKLQTDFEKTGDRLSIKSLYQELNTLHPNYSRFQLELALAHLSLEDSYEAELLLSNLSYDSEYGNIAKNTLSKIRARGVKKGREDPTSISASATGDDIVLPLIPSGSSFLIDAGINQRNNTRLLLDTGASITAFSNTLISRLNLRKTGQVIRISTANGVKNSSLYHVKRLMLGQLVLSNMVVAEIDLAANNKFEGLLGTDALNKLENYGYLIDNQRNVLIFKHRAK